MSVLNMEKIKQEARGRLAKLDAAYGASTDLRTMFPSSDAYKRHMLRAEYESSPALQADYIAAGDFVATMMHYGQR